jgi:hypothetical protein
MTVEVGFITDQAGHSWSEVKGVTSIIAFDGDGGQTIKLSLISVDALLSAHIRLDVSKARALADQLTRVANAIERAPDFEGVL